MGWYNDALDLNKKDDVDMSSRMAPIRSGPLGSLGSGLNGIFSPSSMKNGYYVAGGDQLVGSTGQYYNGRQITPGGGSTYGGLGNQGDPSTWAQSAGQAGITDDDVAQHWSTKTGDGAKWSDTGAYLTPDEYSAANQSYNQNYGSILQDKDANFGWQAKLAMAAMGGAAGAEAGAGAGSTEMGTAGTLAPTGEAGSLTASDMSLAAGQNGASSLTMAQSGDAAAGAGSLSDQKMGNSDYTLGDAYKAGKSAYQGYNAYNSAKNGDLAGAVTNGLSAYNGISGIGSPTASAGTSGGSNMWGDGQGYGPSNDGVSAGDIPHDNMSYTGNEAGTAPQSGFLDNLKSLAQMYNNNRGYLTAGKGLYDMYSNYKKMGDYRDNMNSINGMYQPGTPEANLMQQQMERMDAAHGRNSQYGTRNTDLAAKLAGMRMQALTSPGYLQSMQGYTGARSNMMNSAFNGADYLAKMYGIS